MGIISGVNNFLSKGTWNSHIDYIPLGIVLIMLISYFERAPYRCIIVAHGVTVR